MGGIEHGGDFTEGAGRAHRGLGPCTWHECDRAQLWDRPLGWCTGMKVGRKVTRLTGGSGREDVGLGGVAGNCFSYKTLLR